METSASFWRKCSTCKTGIPFGGKYYVCSVSSCNGQRTGYVFCGMTCFDSHVPGARHRDAGAIAHTAPAAGAVGTGDKRPPARIIVKSQPGAASSAPSIPREVLIVASRLKDYIQARAEMNTSGSVMDVLSDYVRILCDRAIDNARAEGRKTVMDRDFDFLKDK